MRGSRNHGSRHALRFQRRHVVIEMLTDKTGDEVIAMVVTGAQVKHQRVLRGGRRSLQQFRLQLAGEKLISATLVDQ